MHQSESTLPRRLRFDDRIEYKIDLIAHPDFEDDAPHVCSLIMDRPVIFTQNRICAPTTMLPNVVALIEYLPSSGTWALTDSAYALAGVDTAEREWTFDSIHISARYVPPNPSDH